MQFLGGVPSFMHSIIVPAFNQRVTLVKIGSSWVYPTMEEMESIRDWVMLNKNKWLSERKQLTKKFGHTIKIKVFPGTNPNNEYVWLINRADSSIDSCWSEEDAKTWKEVFQESADDPGFILFVWGGYSIKRINKILIPFL